MQTTDPGNLWQAESALALAEARKLKAEKNKDVGSPIQLPGMPLAILVRGNEIWEADNTTVIKRIDLRSGEVRQIYKGHSGPVTCLQLLESKGADEYPLLFTGSWDKTIKVWNTKTKDLIKSIDAHSDFVKALLVIPETHLLVSAGSDKVVRLWDIASLVEGPPRCVGIISVHTRPVHCLVRKQVSHQETTLFTADTLGAVNIWSIETSMSDSEGVMVNITQVGNVDGHRTGVNDMWYIGNRLWTASIDETVLIHPEAEASNTKKKVIKLGHPAAVQAILPIIDSENETIHLITACGDTLRVFDASTSLDTPELLNEIDAHAHDVTGLRAWYKTELDRNGRKGRTEVWVASASLDGTIRRWRLHDLITPDPSGIESKAVQEEKARLGVKEPYPRGPKVTTDKIARVMMTEDEERELEELMNED